LWALPEGDRQITLAADEALAPGWVVLETLAGKAEISLEEQLKEIESGFLDLLRADEKPFL
jgi:flagellar biosynthesis/type III secretory pathway protein FliH